jgi:hypothetical protein
MGVTLVISGSGRGAGKTAVGCALIEALPEWVWTAVKITPDVHGEGSGPGDEKPAAGAQESKRLPRVFIEEDRSSGKGTGRYLAAGARRAVLVTVDPEWRSEPLAELDAVLDEGILNGNLLVESNRFMGEKAILLAVTGVTGAEWKPTLHRCVDEADALVLTNGMEAGDLPERLRGRRIFIARNGEWAPAELVEFLRGRLRDGSDVGSLSGERGGSGIPGEGYGNRYEGPGQRP